MCALPPTFLYVLRFVGGSAKVCGDAHPRPLATGSGTVATGASEKVDQTSSAERAKLSTASGEPVCECERSESALQRTLTSCRKDSSARRPHRRTSSLTRDGARASRSEASFATSSSR